MNDRRHILKKIIPLVAAAAFLPRLVPARELPVLTEADAMAKALGFKLNTLDADQTKYPKHSTEQSCANCLHFIKPGTETSLCDLFSKVVPKSGWCSGYSKRP